MSALRLACLSCSESPRHPHPVLVDVGHGTALGYHHDGGRLAVPEPGDTRGEGRQARNREAQRRLRERRKAVEPRLDDPAWVASDEGQSYLEAYKVARRRERRLERVPS